MIINFQYSNLSNSINQIFLNKNLQLILSNIQFIENTQKNCETIIFQNNYL